MIHLKNNFLLFFILLPLLIQAQNLKKFSDKPEEFIEELKGFVEVNISDANEERLKYFIELWESDTVFTPDDQERIIELSTLLLEKKARSNPHFILFIECLLSLKQTPITNDNYNMWFESAAFIFKKKKYTLNRTRDFFNFTLQFFQDYILYESSSVIWQILPSSYQFELDKTFAVNIDKTDLYCYSKRDSIIIFDIAGKAYPIENEFKVSTALVTWERGGYSRDRIFANLKDFEINLNKSEFRADSVIFTNKDYFEEPLLGELHHKVMRINNADDASYPKFYSYQKNFLIEDLYPDITYQGGLSMEGSKLIGRGTQEAPSHIYIYQNDTLLVNTQSIYFAFKQDAVISRNTSVSILLEQDSIFHPDLSFNYKISTRELTLLRNDNFTSQGPYFNSYHNVDMNFEQLYWNLNDHIMYFTAQRGSSIGNANFESINLFDQRRFDILFGMEYNHPLISMRSFCKKIEREEFTAEEYASYIKKSLTQTRHLLMDLSRSGFIFFDVNTDYAIVKQRLHDYIAANAGKLDYDVINFESSTRTPLENASFNTKTLDLIINGMPQVTVSNVQNVLISPTNSSIILKRNRNFQFDGKINAGLLTFYGSNFFFNYDSFKINMQNIDSLNIRYITGKLDNYGQPIIGTIKNNLRHLTGSLLVDRADNKSGVKDYPEYPLFKSDHNSYVYYDKPSIQNGVYNSTEFYFELDTFVMDSLDNFTKEGLQYQGKLFSAGIFPPLREQLALQSDESLGFLHNTGQEGLPTYAGKGRYLNEIHLSNAGLRGNGDLEYLTSTTKSEDFIFFPDSMNTKSFAFDIQQKTTPTEYPRVNSKNNYIHWLPYQDEMYAYQTDTRFNMFNDSTFLKGDLLLTPVSLSGIGRMDLKNSEIESKYFIYKAFDINADTSDFFLKSLNSDGFTVITENMKSHINYRKKEGYFTSNEEFALVNFPENKYVSYLDYFTWRMQDKTLEMGSKKQQVSQEEVYSNEDGIEPYGPRYISVHPDQDSINFVSPTAYYDYKNNFINAEKVKFIKVADSRAYPHEGKVTIAENARMLTLNNAVLITNDTLEYHRIYDATLRIESRLNYIGEGKYDYVDQNNEVQVINFNEIKVVEDYTTIATGSIIEPDNFTLSPVYHYQGKVYLDAPERFLRFKGSVLIEHNCDMLTPDWLNFDTRIDPVNIYLPINDELININNQNIYAGWFIHYDSVHIYPTFMNKTKFHSDNQLIKPTGFLFYNQVKQEYQITSRAKVGDFTLPDNYLSLHRENCDMYGEGELDLGTFFGLVKFQPYGSITSNLHENKKEFDLITYLDFYLKDELKNIFAWEVDSTPGLEPVDIKREVYVKTLKQKLDSASYRNYINEIGLYGEAKVIPEPIRQTLVFNELHLLWDDETNSYRSVGDIGIASAFNTQINKKVKGYFEIQIKRSGDLLDIYLEIDEDTWYYFGYTRGVLHTLSSNKEYNNFIKDLKAKERKFKIKGNRTPYIFILAADRKRAITYRRWQQMIEKLEGRESEDIEIEEDFDDAN